MLDCLFFPEICKRGPVRSGRERLEQHAAGVSAKATGGDPFGQRPAGVSAKAIGSAGPACQPSINSSASAYPVLSSLIPANALQEVKELFPELKATVPVPAQTDVPFLAGSNSDCLTQTDNKC